MLARLNREENARDSHFDSSGRGDEDELASDAISAGEDVRGASAMIVELGLVGSDDEALKPANKDFRRDNDEGGVEEDDLESFAMGGVIGFISVTNLLNLAIARKQYFAGVVNIKSTGRMWGVPAPLSIAGLYTIVYEYSPS